jgi:hypothetical protein
MEVSNFAEIKTEFMDRVAKAVYCNMATIDRRNRPRSRTVHPIWDGPVGWVIPWRIELYTSHSENIIWRPK